MSFSKKSKNILAVERATNDLRKGFPVLLKSRSEEILVAAAENISEEALCYMGKDAKIILSANRAKYISGDKSIDHTVAIKLKKNDIADIEKFYSNFESGGNIDNKLFEKTSEIESCSLNLVKIAELLPATIVATRKHDDDFLAITTGQIAEYKDNVSYELTESCSVILPMRFAEQGRVVAYRPNLGGKEHYAIIIGNPGKCPLVRVHSSCYTGDLLDSLACDCHDQLHSAIKLMGEGNGGIILYMLQEGRGIGLINKLRAYYMKEKGLDTVDANEALGFDDDERLFLPAAEILKRMDISEVELLTNNPKKAAGLEEYGIVVKKCVPHIMAGNEHNRHYLNTKAERLGHNMGNNQL